MSAPGTDVIAARHRAILEIARHTGSVSVDSLAEQLGVTPQTIRKDLNLLADRAMLARVHGGAIITSRSATSRQDAATAVASRTASLTVRCIFQFPAISGLLPIRSPLRFCE